MHIKPFKETDGERFIKSIYILIASHQKDLGSLVLDYYIIIILLCLFCNFLGL